MSFMEWSNKFGTGNEDVDYQHQRLFKLIDDLYQSLNSGTEMRLMVEVFLDQLVAYTDYHFSTEERLMKESSYPDFENHKALHDKLKEQVVGFQKKFRAGDADVSAELMNFLKDWLVNHIQKVDTKMGPHIGKVY